MRYNLAHLKHTNGAYLNRDQNRIVREEIKDTDLIRLGEVPLKFKCL
jgi:hypothetical protein